ncbi:MAG: type IV pili twitching motility protein PilT, partial [Longicatena sp.]
EIMIATPAIRTQIREGKIHQIDNSIVAGKEQGMQSMDESLFDLYQKGIISKDTAVLYANNAERMSKKIS